MNQFKVGYVLILYCVTNGVLKAELIRSLHFYILVAGIQFNPNALPLLHDRLAKIFKQLGIGKFSQHG